ncbi:MAG: DUF4159 domain-containing protein, partial [Devosiaceae bacterium]|nr:DUF4159 domain-containing protein [Devosiaceae bacterium MH13]
PFAGLSIPDDVRIERQILSEPGAAVASNTYAELADATPLVTGEPRGEGHVILFHITAETSWSNLPLSVLFVDMLERLVGLASATSLQATDTAASAAPAPGGAAGPEPRAQEVQVLAPRAAVDGFGVLGSAPAHAEALLIDAAATPPATAATPPGFYGPADATFALNLFSEPPSLRAAASETFAGVPARALDVPIDQSVDFRPGLLTLALLLACLDALAVLWLSGGLGLKSGFARRAATSAGAMVLAAGLGLALLAPSPVAAQGSNQGSNVAEPGSSAQLQRIIAAVNLTRFAYVLTGDPQLDQRSREGIEGLTRILTQRTAFEPGPPFGIDPMTEELSVYPLIYWPMPDEPMAVPEQLVTRIDAYMNNGGTILFDTRDEQMNLMSGALTPQTANLRALLGALDIPPLEPVPDDHVLTKSFYLIDSFPGRFATGALWVETLPEVDEDARRPARGGDGVSPLMISGNDFASAWALSPEGLPLYATSPPDPVQREFAYRTGVNIAMYVMTGNYKADQVHIPALLERLIQ